MINKANINKEITIIELLDSIAKTSGNEYTFENIRISGAKDSIKVKNRVFENITFRNCSFKYSVMEECQIINCIFIDCSFFDFSLCNNIIMDTEVSGVQFVNNSCIEGNIFDGVKGNLDEKQHYISNAHNYFKNMDFSGFLPAYTNSNFSDCDICCNQNYFYNTKVSIEAIEKLSKRAKKMWKKESASDQNLWRNIFECENLYGDKSLEVAELLVPGNFVIDLGNMDYEEKLNLVASLLVNHFNGSFLRVYKNCMLSEDSIHSFYSTPNPSPARIVDSRGYTLKDGVIKDLNIRVNYDPKNDKWYYDSYDGANLGICAEENSLHNPNNFECKALSMRMN